VDAANNYQSFSSTGLVDTAWADRVQVTDAYQAGLASRNTGGKQSQGVAWEYMILLANATHHDMWINIPVSADDDYVNQLAQLILNGNQYTRGLDKDLNVYVELSNEVWNFSFPQSIFNLIQGDIEGISADQRYMEHVFQIAQIFQNNFGETSPNGRVRTVALWQYTQELTFFNDLAWAEQRLGVPAKSVLYGIGQASYYNASDTSTVDATFATMWTGSDATRRDSIGWASVAAFYGLKNVSYEAGPGSLAAGVGSYVIHDPRMYPSVEHQFLDNWFAVGGDVANYFTLQGAVSNFGTYLLVEDYEHLRTPTYEAAQSVLYTPRPTLTAGNVLPFAPRQSVMIDPSQRTPDIFSNEAKPGSGLVIQAGSPNLYLLRATGTGTYSLRLFGHASDSSAAVDVLVDEKLIGTLTLGLTDGFSSTLQFTAATGLHGLSLAGASSDQTILPPVTGTISIALVSGWGIPVAPSAPANLTAVAGNASVTLNWAPASSASQYKVARSTQSGGPYTTLKTIATNSYIDNSVSNNQKYYYVVSAGSAYGYGALSMQVVSFPSATTAPPSPTGLTASFGGGDFDPFYGGAIAQLSWSSVVGASGYNLYRSTDGTTYTLVNAAPQSGTSYTDLSINNGATYYYTVTAVNNFAQSAKSNAVSGTPVEVVWQPPVLSSETRDGFVFLSWIPDPLTTLQFGTLFNVKRRTSAAGPYTTIIQNSTYNAYDYTAVPGQTYFYVVTTTNGAGESAPSNKVSGSAVLPGQLGYEGGSSDIPQN
jgi:fibronectin type 3 domain-containing protein